MSAMAEPIDMTTETTAPTRQMQQQPIDMTVDEPKRAPVAPPTVSAASSPDKKSSKDLFQPIRDALAAADAAAAEALVGDLKALVRECEAAAKAKRQAASTEALGAARYAVEASCVQPRGKLSLRARRPRGICAFLNSLPSREDACAPRHRRGRRAGALAYVRARASVGGPELGRDEKSVPVTSFSSPLGRCVRVAAPPWSPGGCSRGKCASVGGPELGRDEKSVLDRPCGAGTLARALVESCPGAGRRDGVRGGRQGRRGQVRRERESIVPRPPSIGPSALKERTATALEVRTATALKEGTATALKEGTATALKERDGHRP